MTHRRGSVAARSVDVDPRSMEPHLLHRPDRAYPETNCYADIIIELLHSRGDEPLAAFGCTVRCDFEGDQFTFLKPPPHEMTTLFGVDVHEMQPYRSLSTQAAEQLARHRSIIAEVDAFFLPDTWATTYRRGHVKTSLAVESIDPARRRLTYFHNAGLFDLDGEDFDGVFRLDGVREASELPPYVELVRFDAGPGLSGSSLRSRARELLVDHLDGRPETNPFDRFGAALLTDMQALQSHGADYHAYAFATVRMAGANFEVAASYVSWLLAERGQDAADAFRAVAHDCKILSYKLARRRAFDPAPVIARLAASWAEGQDRLDAAHH